MERRSRRIQAEYEAGARRGDVLAGALPGQGRVSQRLAELGPVWDLTTGGYFEGSEGVHKLIKEMGDAWCKKHLLATGRPPGDGEKSMTTGLLRRRLSTAIVKANLSVLLGRTSMMGDGKREEAVGEDGGDECKEREGGGLEGGHDWEGGGEEGTVLVGLNKEARTESESEPKEMQLSQSAKLKCYIQAPKTFSIIYMQSCYFM